jgi:hypothetical protein
MLFRKFSATSFFAFENRIWLKREGLVKSTNCSSELDGWFRVRMLDFFGD